MSEIKTAAELIEAFIDSVLYLLSGTEEDAIRRDLTAIADAARQEAASSAVADWLASPDRANAITQAILSIPAEEYRDLTAGELAHRLLAALRTEAAAETRE